MSLKNLILILLVIAAGYLYVVYTADKPDLLVKSISLANEKNAKHLDFHFTTPVRFLGAYPESRSDIILMKIRAISFSGFDKNYSILDKSTHIEDSESFHIRDVRYEGNVTGGPFLVVQFTKQMDFKVTEGDGLKSLVVSYTSKNSGDSKS